MKHSRLSITFILTGWFLLLSAAGYAEPTKITFLHFNDISEIEPRGGTGGLASLMTLLEQERANSSHTITTFGGDLFSPSILSGITKGAHMVEMMNAIGTDIAVVGNHEYDFGPEVAAKNFAESEFPWLGTNVLGSDGKVSGRLSSGFIIEKGGYKLGFFGLITQETEFISSPGAEIEFAPYIETAQNAIEELKANGAEVIVALTHMDIADDQELAQKVEGIHLILGGHNHNSMAIVENGIAIMKSGSDAHYLGIIDLNLNRVDKRGSKSLSVILQWRLITTAGVQKHSEIQSSVDNFNAILDEASKEVLGTTSVELDSRRTSVRSRETSMGNLIAEAMRWSVGADVGIANGGGIRGDRIYAVDSKISRKDILKELPFGNKTVLIELSGYDLAAALENSVSRIGQFSGRFLQIAGMTFVYDPVVPVGNRVMEITVGGSPLESTRTYTIAASDFIANGGDEFESLKNGNLLIDSSGAKLIVTALIDYIKYRGTVDSEVDGRIRRL